MEQILKYIDGIANPTTIISFWLSISIFVVTIAWRKIDKKKAKEEKKELIDEIKKVLQPQNASKELKEKTRPIAETIINPKTSEDWIIKAWAAQIDESYEKAVDYYSRAIEYNKPPSLLLIAYNNMGNIYGYKQNYDKAIEYYDKAIEYYNTEFDVAILASLYFNKGVMYRKKNENDKAIQNYKKAIETDPKDIQLYIVLGNFYDIIGNFSCALKYYQRALLINPKEAIVYYELAIAYLSQLSKKFKNNTEQADLEMIEMHDIAMGYMQKAAELGDATALQFIEKLSKYKL